MGKKNGHSDMDLVPTLSDAEVQAILRDGEPPLVDVDALDYTRRLVYQRQKLLLEGYVKYGTVLKAAEYAEVDRNCVYVWRKNDSLRWNERWQMAVEHRREYAEDKYILHRLDNPKGNYGTDVAAIAYMNRLDPEHWTRNVQVTHEVGHAVMATLQRIQEQQEQLPKPGLPEPSADKPWLIEGTVRKEESEG